MWRYALMIAMTAAPLWAEDRALIIGIEGYPQLDLRLAPQSAKDDAIAMAELAVTRWGYDHSQVSMLLDAAATSDAILNAVIDELVGLTAPGDRVLLYFAGLGSRNAQGKRVLLAYDSESLLGRIPEDALSDILDLIADRAVTVIVDAGFSGDIGTPGQRGIGAPGFESRPFAASGDKRAVYAPATATQTAWETARGGVFTTGLIAASKAGASTHFDLSQATARDSRTWCDAHPVCQSQGLTVDFAGPAQAGPLSRDVPVAAATPSDLPNPAGLRLSIDGGPLMTIGQSVTFRVSAKASGTFALWDLAPDGQTLQIAPSPFARDTALTPGIERAIPAPVSDNGMTLRMRVTGPEGNGMLIGAFVPGDPAELDTVMPPSPDLIADTLNTATSLTWSAVTLPYTISEP